MQIAYVFGRQIFDSRGNPTVEAEITLENGSVAHAAAPSGASTGIGEALELRDGGVPYGGKGVMHAVSNINDQIYTALKGVDAFDQSKVDQILIDLDGTDGKTNLGANATTAVSLAVAKAAATAAQLPYFRYISHIANVEHPVLPMPMINIINGGRHAEGTNDIQEYMVVPVGARSIDQALRIGSEIFHSLRNVLVREGYSTTVGDEGGYAPKLRSGNEEALQLIIRASEEAGYTPGKDIKLALDVAASELYQQGSYELKQEHSKFSSTQMIDWLEELARKYPLYSIEDGLGEDDWDGWQSLTKKLGRDIQLIGDDLLVTNTKYLERAITNSSANSILIKPNQIGTLSETIRAVKMAHQAGWGTVMSHRSGETEDTSISHLAVGLGTKQIKCGSMSRGERTAKYNELLRIGESLPEFWQPK